MKMEAENGNNSVPDKRTSASGDITITFIITITFTMGRGSGVLFLTL